MRGGDGELVERQSELATVDHVVERLAAGEGGVALVEGGAGVGKSRLLAEARARASARGCRVLSARGSQLEHDLPLGVVRQLFEALVLGVDGPPPELGGAAAGAARLFGPPAAPGEAPDHAPGGEGPFHGGEGPFLGVGGGGLGPGADGGGASFALLHGLYWLTADVAARQPLALVVDDVHWCDPASLRFLGYLVRRLEGLPVLVVLGLRSPLDPGADVAALGELALDPATVTLGPRPLSEDGVHRLARERFGEEPHHEVVEALHRATGGNRGIL